MTEKKKAPAKKAENKAIVPDYATPEVNELAEVKAELKAIKNALKRNFNIDC
jgi:hypothetical protein